jgi:hypothetical protein
LQSSSLAPIPSRFHINSSRSNASSSRDSWLRLASIKDLQYQSPYQTASHLLYEYPVQNQLWLVSKSGERSAVH